MKNKNTDKNMKINHTKTSIAKYNTKRFSKFRYSLLINFISLVIIYQTFIINNLFDLTGKLIFILLVLMSMPTQVWVYFTKLNLYHYKVEIDQWFLRINLYKEASILIIMVFICINSSSNIFTANIVYSITCLLLSVLNIWIYSWITNTLLKNKDKYYSSIKNAYLSLPKKYR